ncbi:hypothetical protein KR067_002320 [Drosophila pandora]|nr:hypothetical protein KR067_002320 [Drosophila pandora]
MTDVVEAVFISTGSEDNTTCSVQDLRTGTDLMRYKGGGCAQHQGLSIIGLNYLFAANAAKPLIHVWPINKQEQMSGIRFVVPGKVNAMAVTPDAAFLVAGIQENIYLWHLNTGRMLNTISKHYQAVTCLRFTDSGEHFISAGKDGAVLVWNLTSACAPLDTGNGQDSNEPLYSFNDHGLAVTEIYTGIGGTRSYLYTVSLDRCCKIYDLMGGVLLVSVVFPVALHSVIVDKLERSVYVGSAEGKVYVFHTENAPRMTEYHMDEEEAQAFVGHAEGKAITCLALNMSGTTLVTGGEDKQVCVWDTGSRQLIKSIPQNGAVSNLRIRLVSGVVFQPEHKQPEMFADSLKRMISAREENDCIELMPLANQDAEEEDELPQGVLDDELLLKFIAQMGRATAGENGVEDMEETLEEEEDAESEDQEDSDPEEAESEEEPEEPEPQKKKTKARKAPSDQEDDEEEEATESVAGTIQSGSAPLERDAFIEKLQEENRQLKEETKRMFEYLYDYVSRRPQGSPDKSKRKKPNAK